MDKELVHALGGRGSNVMCYNGSAHRRATNNLKHVTCPKCKEALKNGDVPRLTTRVVS